jgi:hypothetical protein
MGKHARTLAIKTDRRPWLVVLPLDNTQGLLTAPGREGADNGRAIG